MPKLLKLLIITAFLNCLSWIILIPVWQYPDEQAHFAQLQDIAELSKDHSIGDDTSYEIVLSEEILGTERDGFGNNKFTYNPYYRYQYSDSAYGPREWEIINLEKSSRTNLVKDEATHNPQLYYFLGSLAYKVFYDSSLFTRILAVRVFSSILFLITIYLAYLIGKIVFPTSKILPVVLSSLVAFKPMLVFSSTGVLPDALTNLLFTAVILLGLKILENGIQSSYLIVLSTLIILGTLTRQQFLIVLPIVTLPVLYSFFKSGKNRSLVILFALFTTLFVSFGFNFLVSIGVLKNLIIPDINLNLKLIFSLQFLEHTVWTVKHTIAEVLPWYWGVYKWLSLTVPHINYQIINRLIWIAFLGLIVRFILMIKKKQFIRTDLILIFMVISSLIYFLVFLVWDYFFRLSHGYSFGIQGKYFFPLITAHMGILLIGFWQIFRLLFKKYASIGIYALILFFIFFNNFSLFYVASSYYDISSFSTFINQVSQYKPLIIKGNTITMILLLSLTFQSIFIFSLGKYIIKRNVST